jgi:hypothetical protein
MEEPPLRNMTSPGEDVVSSISKAANHYCILQRIRGRATGRLPLEADPHSDSIQGSHRLGSSDLYQYRCPRIHPDTPLPRAHFPESLVMGYRYHPHLPCHDFWLHVYAHQRLALYRWRW